MDNGPERPAPADHGGNLAEAMARFGGTRADWLDLSTGINPEPYPVAAAPEAWTRLPDADAETALIAAARTAFRIGHGAGVIAAPGASALIRALPRLAAAGKVAIPGPTYNEHARAFAAEGWTVVDRPEPGVRAAVIVNPNNPDGRRWTVEDLALLAEALDLLVIDESFMDPTPARAFPAGAPNVVVLRSFGKFWGLAGLRLGFVLSARETVAQFADMLGPWPVSGPALEIGARALADTAWAEATRARLAADMARLHDLIAGAGWRIAGGTDLFVTAETPDAAKAQERLARHRIWSRTFPYSATWLRLGLPPSHGWERLEAALA